MHAALRTRLAAALAAALALGLPMPAQAARDPLLGEQWALVEPAAIGAPEAWTQSLGDGVVVAVLDSGVQVDHPDLAANLWRNPREVANGVDDDANGYVDDVHGANILSGGGDVADDDGHGTHVAGIIAARSGNGAGGAGLAPRAQIMAVKILDSDRGGNSALLARGIRYAVDAGARILNVSVNGDASTPELDAALRYAGARGATVVASAGNNGRDTDLRPSFPASSKEPAVLSVTASGQDGDLLSFANRGVGTVDVAAPGQAILSTARGSHYEERAGTSMAAPFAAGALALLAAARPDLGQPELRAALLRSAPRRGLLAGLVGRGELNVGAAMHDVLPGAMWRASSPPPRVRIDATRTVRAGGRATVRWSLTGAAEIRRWRVLLDGRRVATLDAGGPRTLRRRIARAGKHRWRIVAIDAGGARVATATRAFRAVRDA